MIPSKTNHQRRFAIDNDAKFTIFFIAFFICMFDLLITVAVWGENELEWKIVAIIFYVLFNVGFGYFIKMIYQDAREFSI